MPDGSSNDISRVIRFDYADEDYLDISREAYLKWRDEPKYKGIFYPTDYVLASNDNTYGRTWIEKTTAALTSRQLPWTKLEDAAAARRKFPILTGELASPDFTGYHNQHGGWADAAKGISLLRDECLQLGVSFICGRAGTVVGFDTDSDKNIKAAKTLAGTTVTGDVFVLTAGAWATGLVPMYNSALSTAQVLGYIRLTPAEMQKYRDLPIYANFATGWFNFPPHEDTQMLKIAIHGWGYTRTPGSEDLDAVRSNTSAPPLPPRRQRANFAPEDGERRLREGLREMLPELADHPFERLALCWYTDSPTGDFIMDFHVDYKNLFVGSGCSGQYVSPASIPSRPVFGSTPLTRVAVHTSSCPCWASTCRRASSASCRLTSRRSGASGRSTRTGQTHSKATEAGAARRGGHSTARRRPSYNLEDRSLNINSVKLSAPGRCCRTLGFQ